MVPRAKASISKTPIGPFQTMVCASKDFVDKQGDRFGADIQCHPVGREGPIAAEYFCLCVAANLSARRDLPAIESGHPWSRPFHGLARHIQLVGFQQRFADILPFGFQERIRHASADQQCIDLVEQVLDHFNFVGYLCAADNGDKRFVGLVRALPM